MLKIFPLSYHIACTQYFQTLRHLGNAVLLDSGYPQCKRGRYDIISAAPSATLRCEKGVLNGENLPFDPTLISDPFHALSLLQTHALDQLVDSSGQSSVYNQQEVPFSGGLLGHFGYDLGRTIEQLPSIAVDDIELPEMQLGLYTWAVIVDHHTQDCYLIGSDLIDQAGFNQLSNLLSQAINLDADSNSDNFQLTSPFVSNVDEDNYTQALQQIDDYILNGDCYQVNFAQRFSANCKGDPFHAYLTLREAAPTHFSAFIDTSQGAILSLSPERFLQVDEKKAVITQPIKGTQPRSSDPVQDQANIDYLHSSEKDQSENLMIVDLMRNDISKSCQLHSVKVPSLFAVESYQNVHHLVSTVTGQLEDDQTAIDLMRNCFPGGSITGAPKIRSMEIIDELEPHRRSVYCGSIGYISLCGRMDSSITIRTLLVENQNIYCWAGGGIVADSVIESEYQETFDKVNNLLNALRKNHSDNAS